MFKEGTKISITRPTYSQRQRKPNDLGVGDWILEKGKDKTVNGVVAELSKFYLPVTLEDKSVKQILYQDLKFLSGNRASFQSKLPDRHKVLLQPDGSYKEINATGKAIRITGKLLLSDVYIPVLIGDELKSIPYNEITFKEKK